jgi:DNA anti-recombination protein RmuC
MVSDLGRDLYKRLSTMGDEIVSMGRSLGSSVGSYNEFSGSLEGSVSDRGAPKMSRPVWPLTAVPGTCCHRSG